MAKAAFKWLIIANAVIGFGVCAWAQEIDVGKIEYQSSCAVCHGADGKGKGPLRAELKSTPPDLTVLAKKNNGVFPYKAVTEVIDGRKAFKTHGTREMPIWGYRYTPMPNLTITPISPDAKKAYQSLNAYYYSESLIRNRILAIVDYLYRIQTQ
jgi:Cytochrome c